VASFAITLHILLVDAAEELIPASPASISLSRSLDKGEEKSHRINPPTNFSSLPRSTSVLSAILYSSLLPALVPAYGLCFLFLLADLAYPYGDLFT